MMLHPYQWVAGALVGFLLGYLPKAGERWRLRRRFPTHCPECNSRVTFQGRLIHFMDCKKYPPGGPTL